MEGAVREERTYTSLSQLLDPRCWLVHMGFIGRCGSGGRCIGIGICMLGW